MNRGNRVIWLLSLFCLVSLTLLQGCSPKAEKEQAIKLEAVDSLNFAFPTKLSYAKGFSVEEHQNYKIIRVKHPLTGQVLASYVTALDPSLVPDNLRLKASVVRVPASSIVCLSTTQISALDLLGVPDKLIGCATPQYIWNPYYRDRIKQGAIQKVSEGMDLNPELVASLSPELLMLNFMNQSDAVAELAQLGIVSLYNNEFKEANLLARAEWLKFIALFFCREAKADSLFRAVEHNYKDAQDLAHKAEHKPKVMYGYDYRGTWYLPQSETYVAQSLRDAGAYFIDAGQGNSSVPKSFEEIYERYNDADLWLTTQGKLENYQDFIKSNERYQDFSAARRRAVYCNNKRALASGGNDYWESAIYRPDLLLKDLVKIVHPELLPDYETVYWQKLE